MAKPPDPNTPDSQSMALTQHSFLPSSQSNQLVILLFLNR
jgi:hypothetical protein